MDKRNEQKNYSKASMYGIFTYIWLIFMVNVGKYTIRGSYGKGDLSNLSTLSNCRLVGFLVNNTSQPVFMQMPFALFGYPLDQLEGWYLPQGLKREVYFGRILRL